MQALDALLNRVSVPRLLDPAPTAEQREVLFAAAMRAPDHGHLQPWRFLTVEGQAREQLGEILAQAALAQDAEAPQAVVDKARNGPLRAPLVVVVIAKLQDHVKYPKSEQLLAAGCAGGMLLVPMNALLQHRGMQVLSSGRSIAVQGFNENLSVLLMLAAPTAAARPSTSRTRRRKSSSSERSRPTMTLPKKWSSSRRASFS